MKRVSGRSLLAYSMDKKRFFGVVLLALMSCSLIYGQTKAPQTPPPTIVEQIMIESDSIITIDIPPAILENILKKAPTGPAPKLAKPGVNKTNGYRIQVFSDGRDPSTLESRAKARGRTVLARFPKYRGQVYTTSSAPNWFTRVGNFETSEEAKKALAELKSAFPSFAGEMRIVKSPIIVIKK
ncbi:MAG: SPOR domain-containing protein [Muribaculaceae bacterium]|nr:SPOR domain-containing protein [Muribaculaceae bacterium]